MAENQSTAGTPPGNPSTTAQDFARLLAEHDAAFKALQAADGTPEYREASERDDRAWRAVLEARPTDPATMGRQLRWMLDQGALDVDAEPAPRHIAEQLEAMAAA